MAASDAYAASGGWGGGSQALSPGGVLTNYYQKLQTRDPNSGSLSVAQPAQATVQPSSLSRVAATSQGATAQPTQPTQPTQAVAIPTIAAVPTIAAAPVQLPQSTSRVLSLQTGQDTSAGATPAKRPVIALIDPKASLASVKYQGPQYATYTDPAGVKVNAIFNPATGKYQAIGQPVIPDFAGQGASFNLPADKVQPLIDEYVNRLNTQYQDQLQDFATQKQQYDARTAQINQANLVAQTQLQQQADAKAQADAQDALDRANVFSLAQGLQAPNTQAVDQAGTNDLARIISQYRSGVGGADGAALGGVGAGAAATQSGVNAVNHDTAYANAFNQNYQTFTNALTAQQTADANASGQKLANDIQGVNQAVQLLQQQSNQLTAATKTKFDTALIPLQKLLQEYDLAVKNYGYQSAQSIQTATAILSGASQLASSLV